VEEVTAQNHLLSQARPHQLLSPSESDSTLGVGTSSGCLKKSSARSSVDCKRPNPRQPSDGL